MSDLAFYIALTLGTLAALVSLIWVSWPIGLLSLISLGILYYAREAVLLLGDAVAALEERLEQRRE